MSMLSRQDGGWNTVVLEWCHCLTDFFIKAGIQLIVAWFYIKTHFFSITFKPTHELFGISGQKV